MAEESKLKSAVAIYLVLCGMAAFVYLLIKLPLGSDGSSGSGWQVECHRIGVRVVAETSRQPVENAQVAWWPPPKPEHNRAASRSPIAPEQWDSPSPVADKPKAIGATGPNGQCVLSVTVWSQGGAGSNGNRDAGGSVLEGVLKVRAKGFEEFYREMSLPLPPDPAAPVDVVLKPADAGHLDMENDIVALGGYRGGADTALVLKPAYSYRFFEMKIREILCFPREAQ